MTNRYLKTLLPFTNPRLLIFGAASYTLGASIARYLGRAASPLNFWFGMAWTLLLILAMNFLTAYFRPSNEPLIRNETLKERNWTRAALFQVALAALGVVAVLTVALLFSGISAVALFFALLILFAAMFYALPPVRLITRGFGELLLAVFFSLLLPAFALSLQMGVTHRLLGALAFPLLALSLAFFLLLDFPLYAEDRKYERGSLLVRIGWERATTLHHVLILTAYLLFAAMPLLGFPRALFVPVFYVAPFAFFQIFWLQKITQGTPPNWKFFKLLVYSVIGLTLYILIVTFWLR
jgi:1,4-dihydroxy-2-naphthoate octaprenyltransferase